MSSEFVFVPNRRFGMVFHIFVILALLAGAGFGMWRAFTSEIGILFVVYLLPALLALLLVPVLVYRAYALQVAYYALEREGVHLRWGLRYEDIPMDAIDWVHSSGELDRRPLLPRPHWPGAVLGTRLTPGLGKVEYLASSSRQLVLIAAQARIFAISPSDALAFLRTFQNLTELGSLSSIPQRSVYPGFLLTRVWEARTARLLLITGLALSLILLVWVGLTISGQTQVHLGFHADSGPGDLVPSVRLFLLPVLSWIFFLGDFLAGLFFFRTQDGQALAYLLWGWGVITPLLFLAGVLFILQSG